MPTAGRSWDLSGRLSVTAAGLEPGQDAALDDALDPFPSGPASDGGDVALVPLVDPAPVERHGPAKDGLTSGVDREGRLLVLRGDAWLEVPPPEDGRVELGVGPGLDLGACWRDLVRPVLHQALRHRGVVAVHGAAVDAAPTGGTLVAGWSESGKTEVALALAEAGGRLLSDKWTVAGDDGALTAFPGSVGVRGWALPALPALRAALPARARRRLVVAGAARTALAPAGRSAGAAGRALRRAVELGDRAGVPPGSLHAAYGAPAPSVRLETLVLLVNGPGPVAVTEPGPHEVAARLARTAAYERRDHFDLQERGAYAGLPGRAGARERSVAEETAALVRLLQGGPRVLQVRCPYPGDPRRVVEALAAHR